MSDPQQDIPDRTGPPEHAARVNRRSIARSRSHWACAGGARRGGPAPPRSARARPHPRVPGRSRCVCGLRQPLHWNAVVVPRGAAVALVQLAATVVMIALVWIVVPPLVSQLHLFAQDAPSYVTRFHRIRNEYVSIKRRRYPEAGTFDSQVSAVAARLAGGVGGRLVDLPLSAAQMLFNLTMVYVLSTLLALRRERVLDAALLMVSPHRRDRAHEVMDKIWIRLGGYLRAKLRGHGVRWRADVRRAAAARRAVRRSPVGDRGVRRAGTEGRRVDRAHPAADDRGVSGLGDAWPDVRRLGHRRGAESGR